MQRIQIDNGIPITSEGSTPLQAQIHNQYEVHLLYDDICKCGINGADRNTRVGCAVCHVVVDVHAQDSITAAMISLVTFLGTWGGFGLSTAVDVPTPADPPTNHLDIDWFVKEGLQIGVMLLD